MKRFFAVAAGRVQRVGFRDHVYRETFNLDIFGYVKNLDAGEVEIVAEGSEEELRALIERINIIRYPIAVKSFSVTWQEATGEFTTFEIIRGDLQEELFERVDFAGHDHVRDAGEFQTGFEETGPDVRQARSDAG